MPKQYIPKIYIHFSGSSINWSSIANLVTKAYFHIFGEIFPEDILDMTPIEGKCTKDKKTCVLYVPTYYITYSQILFVYFTESRDVH